MAGHSICTLLKIKLYHRLVFFHFGKPPAPATFLSADDFASSFCFVNHVVYVSVSVPVKGVSLIAFSPLTEEDVSKLLLLNHPNLVLAPSNSLQWLSSYLTHNHACDRTLYNPEF